MHSTIATITDDFVLYRSLEPCDPRLPGLAALREQLGLAPHSLPRKRHSDYARVVLAIIEAARKLHNLGPASCFIVVGDTENDRQFTENLRSVSGLPTLGFIAADSDEAPSLTWKDDTASANRWHLIDEFMAEAPRRGIEIGPGLVALFDIDKTLLGPRGRNDPLINGARLMGGRAVGKRLLGDALDLDRLDHTYRSLCQSSMHPFTLDNQDIVVYTSLLICSDLVSLEEIAARAQQQPVADFASLLAETADRLPEALREIHAMVQAAVAQGDPTAFKAFRHEEFRYMVEIMRNDQLTLCGELLALGEQLRAAGAICMAASDKPGEASLPSPEQAAEGLLPLHRTPALVSFAPSR